MSDLIKAAGEMRVHPAVFLFGRWLLFFAGLIANTPGTVSDRTRTIISLAVMAAYMSLSGAAMKRDLNGYVMRPEEDRDANSNPGRS